MQSKLFNQCFLDVVPHQNTTGGGKRISSAFPKDLQPCQAAAVCRLRALTTKFSCGSHRLLKMLSLALHHLEPAHPAGIWTGKRFRKCCRGFPNSTCGFPNSCSSSRCWPHLWVCVFPSTKTQCQPRSCCFSRRKILLPFLKICPADSKFPSPSPAPPCWEEPAGTEGFGVVLAVTRHWDPGECV